MDKTDYIKTDKLLNEIDNETHNLGNTIFNLRAALNLHSIANEIENGETSQSNKVIKNADKKLDSEGQKLLFEAEKLYTLARKIYVETHQYEKEKDMEIDQLNGFIYKINKEDREVYEEITSSVVKKMAENVFYFRVPELSVSGNNSDSFLRNRHDKTIRELVNGLLYQYRFNIEDYKELWEKYTVYFVHHYTKTDDRKDTDNIRIKRVIDGLGSLLVANDSVKNLHIVQLTEEDETAFTEVFVIRNHNEHYFFKGKMYNLKKDLK